MLRNATFSRCNNRPTLYHKFMNTKPKRARGLEEGRRATRPTYFYALAPEWLQARRINKWGLCDILGLPGVISAGRGDPDRELLGVAWL
jgi:hypothetical protein